MKKYFVLLATVTLFFTSCKSDKKNDKEEVVVEEVKTIQYEVNSSRTTIEWTAFKTTAKAAVKGKFTTLNLANSKPASTPIDAYKDLEFSIPVSSIFTENEDRDNKLKEFFFGAMANTELLSGKFTFDAENKCNLSITMNDTTHSIPVEYTVEGNKVSFKGSLNLTDWNGANAIASINKACFDLHKGDDGVSKTWDEVLIESVSYVDEK